MKKIKFWLKIVNNYIFRGWPLSSRYYKNKFYIGFRNRGLLDYKNLSEYEPLLQELINRNADDSVFIDVGANVGLMTFIAAQNNYFKRGLAFEPSDSFEFLKKNIDDKNFSLYSLAVSDAKGVGRVIKSRNAARDFIDYTNMNNSSINTVVDSISSKEIIEMIGRDESIFLKVDIEGGEKNIDWEVWLCDKRCKDIVIEVWDELVLNSILEKSRRYNFIYKLYNDRFDEILLEASYPINIHLYKVD